MCTCLKTGNLTQSNSRPHGLQVSDNVTLNEHFRCAHGRCVQTSLSSETLQRNGTPQITRIRTIYNHVFGLLQKAGAPWGNAHRQHVAPAKPRLKPSGPLVVRRQTNHCAALSCVYLSDCLIEVLEYVFCHFLSSMKKKNPKKQNTCETGGRKNILLA